MEDIVMMPEPLLAPWDDKELEVSSIHHILTCFDLSSAGTGIN